VRTISKAFYKETTRRLRRMAAHPKRTNHPDAPGLAKAALRLIAALKRGETVRGGPQGAPEARP
jgi:hypothetical protein